MKNISKIALFFLCINSLNKNSLAHNALSLIKHVEESIQKANSLDSKLNESILNLEGMSSAKVRHFLNNLCSLPEARYLEIGVYHGSTFISALYKNNLLDAIAIDNWSEFGFHKFDFLNNTNNYLPENSFRFHEGDCFALDLKALFTHPITIYFYDGNHSLESHKQAFTYFDKILDDIFIAVVDDWNWGPPYADGPDVQHGTKQAFEELGYIVLFERALPAHCHPDKENWWNGLYVAVIQKSK